MFWYFHRGLEPHLQRTHAGHTQAGSSNGGQRPSLNSGFPPRRGWPIRCAEIRRTDQRIEITGDGCVVHKRLWLCFWSHRRIKWGSITAIRAVLWDCFSCHAFGYRLLLSDGTSVCMTDLDHRWDDFREKLHEAYPGIDSAVVRQVEEAFPGETELTCWNNQEAQQAGSYDGG